MQDLSTTSSRKSKVKKKVSDDIPSVGPDPVELQG